MDEAQRLNVIATKSCQIIEGRSWVSSKPAEIAVDEAQPFNVIATKTRQIVEGRSWVPSKPAEIEQYSSSNKFLPFGQVSRALLSLACVVHHSCYEMGAFNKFWESVEKIPAYGVGPAYAAAVAVWAALPWILFCSSGVNHETKAVYRRKKAYLTLTSDETHRHANNSLFFKSSELQVRPYA